MKSTLATGNHHGRDRNSQHQHPTRFTVGLQPAPPYRGGTTDGEVKRQFISVRL